MKRGELWWAKLDKRRPVVLVSRDEAYAVRGLIIAVPAITTVRGYALEIKVGRKEGLPRECVLNADWLVTLPKEDLIACAGALSAVKLRQLDEALRFALALDA